MPHYADIAYQKEIYASYANILVANHRYTQSS